MSSSIIAFPTPPCLSPNNERSRDLTRRAETFDRSDDLYTEYNVHRTMRADIRCDRTAEWKWKRDFLNASRDEFYDLRNDPGETTNLATSDRREAKAAFAKLIGRIHQRMAELSDPVGDTAAKWSAEYQWLIAGYPNFGTVPGLASRWLVNILPPPKANRWADFRLKRVSTS